MLLLKLSLSLVPRVWLDRNKTDVPAEAFPSPAELERSGRPSHRPLRNIPGFRAQPLKYRDVSAQKGRFWEGVVKWSDIE